MKGRFIVFDGVDGSGKDTIIEELEKDFKEINVDYVVFKDPSPEVAKEIREVILNTEGLEESTRLYLYLAARSELIHKQILPALDLGKTVICNRFYLSTYAYQGLHFSKESILEMHRLGGLDIVKPDLEIVLLSKKSHREESDEDVMGDYCNKHREEIIDRYLEFKNPALNVVWTDNKDIPRVHEEVLSLLDIQRA